MWTFFNTESGSKWTLLDLPGAARQHLCTHTADVIAHPWGRASRRLRLPAC